MSRCHFIGHRLFLSYHLSLSLSLSHSLSALPPSLDAMAGRTYYLSLSLSASAAWWDPIPHRRPAGQPPPLPLQGPPPMPQPGGPSQDVAATWTTTPVTPMTAPGRHHSRPTDAELDTAWRTSPMSPPSRTPPPASQTHYLPHCHSDALP